MPDPYPTTREGSDNPLLIIIYNQLRYLTGQMSNCGPSRVSVSYKDAKAFSKIRGTVEDSLLSKSVPTADLNAPMNRLSEEDFVLNAHWLCGLIYLNFVLRSTPSFSATLQSLKR